MTTRTKTTKPVANPEINPCADLQAELDDITKGSVIFKTAHIETMMGWAASHMRENQGTRRTIKKTEQNRQRIVELDAKYAHYSEIAQLLIELRHAD